MRFMTLIWNTRDRTETDAARLVMQRLHSSGVPWRRLLERDGFNVFHFDVQPSSSRVYMLEDNAGVVLGTLFQREQSAFRSHRKSAINSAESAEILASAGRWLFSRCWGRYVLFLHDPRSARSKVAVDPSGGVKCLHTSFDGVHLFFSTMQDCTDLNLLNVNIDWRYIESFLVTPIIQHRMTAVTGVSEIQQGECIEIDREHVQRHWYWHPFEVATSNIVRSPDVATTVVRETTVECLHAWASSHDRIVARLSGGLDSSAVVGVVATAPSNPTLIAVHESSEGTDADERDYADLAASHAKCELIKLPLKNMVQFIEPPISERPEFYVTTGQTLPQLCKSLKAKALYSGDYGDQLYVQNYGHFAAADAAVDGLYARVFRIAWDIALMENITIWEVLGQTLKHRFSKSKNPLTNLHDRPTLAAREIMESASSRGAILHPWFESNHYVPPGKRWHIYALSNPVGRDNPLREPGDPEYVAPFSSQPLMEACLRIPIYLHVADGWTRAIMRGALSDYIHPQTLWRYTKASVEDPLGAVVSKNRQKILDTLMNGRLRQRHMLDVPKVEKVLNGQPSDTAVSNGEVLLLYSLEEYLRRMAELSQPRPVYEFAQ